jgi:hypothetical protein
VNIGRQTDQGIALTSLIGNDFVAHMHHTVSLSRGIPPEYIHFAGDTLRYYWLSFILPAFVYSFPGAEFSLTHIMILNQLFCSFLFWGILVFTLQHNVTDRKIHILVLILALFGYSFNGLYVILKYLITHYSPTWFIQLLKTKGLLDFSNLSHGFFRFYVFESQTLYALSLTLACLYCLITYSEQSSQKRNTLVLIGFLSGITIGVDVIVGLLLAFVVFIFFVFDIALPTMKKGGAFQTVSFSYPVVLFPVVIYSLYFILDMFSLTSGQQGFVIRPQKMVLLFLPFFLFLEYGPLFIFGAFGTYIIFANRTLLVKYYSVIILMAFSAFIVLFVDVQGTFVANAGVLKGGRTIFLSLLLLSSLALEDFFRKRRTKSLKILFSLLILFALPTLFIDLRTLCAIEDVKNTRYISPADFAAAKWLKINTSSDAVVQAYSDKSSYAITTFGERKMVLGWFLARDVLHDNIKGISDREKEIDTLFLSGDVKNICQVIEKNSIDYIYVGHHDRILLRRNGCSECIESFNSFPKVYFSDGVTIFDVRKVTSIDSKQIAQLLIVRSC